MEGFDVVILEANEARTSVVASNLEGLRDMVQDGRNGFKVAPLNAHLFVQTIDDVLERNCSVSRMRPGEQSNMPQSL